MKYLVTSACIAGFSLCLVGFGASAAGLGGAGGGGHGGGFGGGHGGGGFGGAAGASRGGFGGSGLGGAHIGGGARAGLGNGMSMSGARVPGARPAFDNRTFAAGGRDPQSGLRRGGRVIVRGSGYGFGGYGVGGYGLGGYSGYGPDYAYGDNEDPLETGRSAAETSDVCVTPVTQCQLSQESYVGQRCSCSTRRGRSTGRVKP